MIRLGGLARAENLALEPDHRHWRLLRARRERPRCCHTAEQRDELAPSNVTCHAPSLGGMPSQTMLHRYSIIHVLHEGRNTVDWPFDPNRSRASAKGFCPRLYADVTPLKLNSQRR